MSIYERNLEYYLQERYPVQIIKAQVNSYLRPKELQELDKKEPVGLIDNCG